MALSVGSGLHRVIVLLLAGLLIGAGVTLLRRLPISGGSRGLRGAVAARRTAAVVRRASRAAMLSIVTVGMGVSLGREAAPQLAGAATASSLSQWAQLPQWQRRLLVASGAGAGFAAVYNVPAGRGAVRARGAAGDGGAAAGAAGAGGVGDRHRGRLDHARDRRTPTTCRPTSCTRRRWCGRVLVGPLIGVAAVGWVRLIGSCQHAAARTAAGRFVAPLVVFGLLGRGLDQIPAAAGQRQGDRPAGGAGRVSSLGLFAVRCWRSSRWPPPAVWAPARRAGCSRPP